jgi:hypothetical protein
MTSPASRLENLARAKQLNAEPPGKDEVGRLLASAEAQLRDSRNATLAAPSRFMLAYNAAHALAFAALRRAGFRPSSAGHRKIIFQVLAETAGAPAELWLALDRYHDRRNAAEYEGALPPSAIEAEDLVRLVSELDKLVRRRLARSDREGSSEA